MPPTPPGQITYCLGYWALPGNTKNSIAHYDTLPQTLALLRGSNLMVMHDDPGFLARVSDLAVENDIRLQSRQIPLETLPGWAPALTAVESCRQSPAADYPRPEPLGREKGVVQYWRDLTDSGPDIYRAMVAIWFSKIPLVAALAAENPFGTPWFAWVDASVARFNNKRAHWNFTERTLKPGRIAHFRSDMRMHDRLLPLNASILLGDAPTWDRFATAFELALPNCLSEAYGHDEETVIRSIHAATPELFDCMNPLVSAPLWRRALRRARRALPSRSGSSPS